MLTSCFLLPDTEYLRSVMPSTVEEGFFQYLETVNAGEVTVASFPEGSVVFPRVGMVFARSFWVKGQAVL